MFTLPDFSSGRIDGGALVELVDRYGQQAFVRILEAFEGLHNDRVRHTQPTGGDPQLRQAVDDLREKGIGVYRGLFADPAFLEAARARCLDITADAETRTAEQKTRSWRDPVSQIKYQSEYHGDTFRYGELGLPKHGRLRAYLRHQAVMADPVLSRIYRDPVFQAVYRADYGLEQMTFDLLFERIDPSWEGDFWWHFDTPWHYMKMAILLEDVDMTNAPVRYKIGSHKLNNWKRNHALYEYFLYGYDFAWPSYSLVDSMDGEIVYGTGKAGDAFFFETSGLHSGTRCVEGRRLILTVYPTAYSVKGQCLYQLHNLFQDAMKRQGRPPETWGAPPAGR